MSSAPGKDHSGWLTKRGGQRKTWKRRWFRLKGDVLFYYRNPTDSTALGYIPLAGSEVLRHPIDPKTPERHMFEISGGERKILAHHHESFLLYADTNEEMETWISVLNRIIREPRGGGMFGRNIGLTLREETRHFGKGLIPVIMEKTISFLREKGLNEVGLFRLPGNQVRVMALRESFDKGENPILFASEDNHTVASLLKLYLRELPEPLIPHEYYDMFLASARVLEKDESKGVEQIIKQFKLIPKANFDLMKFLCRFLNEIQEHSEINKMTLANLGTVFGPNILRPQNTDPHSLMESTNLMALLTKSMISKHDVIFPHTTDEDDFPQRDFPDPELPPPPVRKEKSHSRTLGPRATVQGVMSLQEDGTSFHAEFRMRKGSAPSSGGGSFIEDGERGSSESPSGAVESPELVAREGSLSETDAEQRILELEERIQGLEKDLEQERKARHAWERRYKQEAVHREDAERHCNELREQLDAFCASLIDETN